MLQAFQCSGQESQERLLDVRTAKASCIEVACYELQQPHVGCKQIMSSLLPFFKCRSITWCKFFFDVERIRVPPKISNCEVERELKLTRTSS